MLRWLQEVRENPALLIKIFICISDLCNNENHVPYISLYGRRLLMIYVFLANMLILNQNAYM